MFHIRSIRRKLLVVLGVVVLMLGTLVYSGWSGLNAYHEAVEHLEYTIARTPRRADLVAAFGEMFDPLLWETADPGQVRDFQREQFQLAMLHAEEELKDFGLKWEALPPTDGARARFPVTVSLLSQLNGGLRSLQRKQTEAFASGDWQPDQLVRDVARLQMIARELPDAQEGLEGTLAQTKSIFASRKWLMWTSGGVVIAGVLLMFRFSYQWIFVPIRKLHAGARRVANGDFDYRLRCFSNDEMSDLANAFNDMTARFQETAANLDGQVRDRSRQLVRSERLAGVGFLAAGVAHEINNPLSAIAMAAESLEMRTAENRDRLPADAADCFTRYLRMMQREAERCRQITRRLLDFARTQDTTRSRHDLVEIINEVQELVSHLGKFKNHHIEFTPSGPCYAEVNGSEIKQVVLNLVANALESMEEGGTLSISLQEQTDLITLTFVDDGCGMTDETIENLFEPFFTRKTVGKGTGLGLSISHRIIRDHGGTIEALSPGTGHGSTFQIQLPRRAAISKAA